MKWISVEDQPAPKHGNIWFVDDGLGQGNCYWDEEMNDWCFELFAGPTITLPDRITHWQPLPNPPEVK